MENFKQFVVVLCVPFFLGACQSAYIVKPQSLAKSLGQQEELVLYQDDDNYFRLPDIYQNHRGLVVFFWQPQCPCAARYQERIQKLVDQYGPHGIAFAQIFSNTNYPFEQAQAQYQKTASTLPLLQDRNKKLASAIGAKGTPAAALIDQNGDLRFLGWIDNERRLVETGRIPYLEGAIKEYLADLEITTKTSPMFGCEIR